MATKPRPTETIELEYAIEVDGVAVDVLSMRRPTVRDQLTFEEGKGGEARKVIAMIANLCEIPPKSVEQLDQSDFVKLTETLQGFQATQSQS